jgi:hypothetical protein
VFRGYADIIMSGPPDELSIATGVLSAPDGGPVAFVAPMWSGDLEQGEKFMAKLRRLGTPIVDTIAPITYLDWLHLFEAAAPPRRHYFLQTRSLRGLKPEVVSALIDGGSRKTSPFSAIIVQDFRGAAARVPIGASAFGLREEHFMVEMIAAWESASDRAQSNNEGQVHEQWARELSRELAPYALPGGYANVLGPDEREQSAQAFGSNSDRLLRAKGLFDPDGVFTSAIALPI